MKVESPFLQLFFINVEWNVVSEQIFLVKSNLTMKIYNQKIVGVLFHSKLIYFDISVGLRYGK